MSQFEGGESGGGIAPSTWASVARPPFISSLEAKGVNGQSMFRDQPLVRLADIAIAIAIRVTNFPARHLPAEGNSQRNNCTRLVINMTSTAPTESQKFLSTRGGDYGVRLLSMSHSLTVY